MIRAEGRPPGPAIPNAGHAAGILQPKIAEYARRAMIRAEGRPLPVRRFQMQTPPRRGTLPASYTPKIAEYAALEAKFTRAAR